MSITPTTTILPTHPSGPAPLAPGDDDHVGLAAAIGEVAARHAAAHDADATFVAEGYDAMRDQGYLKLAVPRDLGGHGASLRQVCYAQAELARHDGATALASAMHQYNVLLLAYRRRRGAAETAELLSRVADEGAVIATSGGSDWLHPRTVAEPVPGGYRVSGRKAFCSQVVRASAITTSAVVGTPGPGAEVHHFVLPLPTEGATVVETWDTLGMRGTASHDLLLEDVFVPEASVAARRPWGRFHPALLGAAIHFAPVTAATYWGIAAAAFDTAFDAVAGGTRSRSGDSVARSLGQARTRLRVAWWSLLGVVTELGDDYALDGPTLATVMAAKREVVLAAREVVDGSRALVGGASFYRRHPLERAWRDVNAAPYHPLDPETTLVTVGRALLGWPLEGDGAEVPAMAATVATATVAAS